MSTKNKFISFIIVSWLITLLIACYQQNEYESKYNDMVEYINIIKSANVVDENNKDIEEYIDVWVTKDTKIKKEPNINSENVGYYYWNAEVTVMYIDDNWAQIKGTNHYVNRKHVSEDTIKFKDYDAPANNTIKSYMDYRYITSVSSKQYKLQANSGYTGSHGLRMVNGRYCVALGSHYTTTIGQYVDVELENGKIIKCILADCKSDAHTDSTNRINPNGSVLEFVVDTDALDYTAMMMGDISYVNGWDSKVVSVRVYDKVEDF